MVEKPELRGGERQNLTLEGYRYKATFMATRQAGEYVSGGGCHYYTSTHKIFWWNGDGAIIDKEQEKEFRFIFDTKDRCGCCYLRDRNYIHTLRGAIVSFKQQFETVAPKPVVINEQQVVDLALQKIVEQIEEFESTPEEERESLIPKVRPVALEVDELINTGLVFDYSGQRHMPLVLSQK